MQTVLVTGATGSIGPSLVNYLGQQGYNVSAYCRTIPPIGLLPGDVKIVIGDITDPTKFHAALENVETVYHLAGLAHIENPPPGLQSEYQRINVEGTRIVTEAASKAGLRRMVYFSTVKVYGIQQRQPVKESWTPKPETFYAKSKLEAEAIARSANGVATVTLRLSPVYGPRLKGSWERMSRAIKKGVFMPIGKSQNVRSLTYVDDVARAAQLLAEHPSSAGEVFNVVGHEAVSMREIYAAIYAAYLRKMPNIYLPRGIAKLGAWLLQTAFTLVGKRSPITPSSIQQLTESETYSGQKLRQYGFTPGFTLNDGWKYTIQGQ